jgi:dolichol-phosphate mannosyltransferase
MLSSAAPFVAVMDADLQHDERVLPAMLERLRRGEADLVAGTRYAEGGSAASFSGSRGTISRLATRLTHRLVGTELSDPMSGFFMMRRDRFDGESKFNAQVGVEFLGLLLAKMTGDLVDPRFIFFALVGTIGLAVHLLALRTALFVLPDDMADQFRVAQACATLVAMTSNFLLNNELTYRDRRLKGWAMLRGFVLFCVFASVGVLANIDLASWLYVDRSRWLVAGAAGAIMSALWNYAMSTLFVWRAR